MICSVCGEQRVPLFGTNGLDADKGGAYTDEIVGWYCFKCNDQQFVEDDAPLYEDDEYNGRIPYR